MELLERTYIFALEVQKAVKEKNMNKIYSYLDEEMPYQRKSDFKDKLFDEVFTEEQEKRLFQTQLTVHALITMGGFLEVE